MKISIGQNQAGNPEVGGGGQNPNQSNGESFFKKRYDSSRERSGGIRNQGPSHQNSQSQESEDFSEKGNKKAMKVLDVIIRSSIFITVFFLPLFFWVNVPSVLELNKQMFLIVVVGIGFLAWVGKMAWRNEIRFKKSFILVPIITFLAVFGLSTVFSSYVEKSLWGYFGAEGGSFITTLFFVALFFLILNTINERKEAVKLVLLFLGSGAIAAIFGILQIDEIYLLPIQEIKANYFNTIGSVYIFSAYIAALLLMTLTLFLSDISKIFKIILVLLSAIFFYVLVAIGFKVVLIALMIGMALLLGVAIMRSGTASKNQSKILPMIFLILTLFVVLKKQPVFQKNLPVEVFLNQKTSFGVTLKSFGESPMLGHGPMTYPAVYQKFRPVNLGNFWSVNFNNAVSYFLTLASTMGILGTLAFLFLVATGVIFLFRSMARSISSGAKRNEDAVAVGMGIVWLFVTIMLFLYLANISLLLLWWSSLALFLSFAILSDKIEAKEFVSNSKTPSSSLTLSFVFVVVIIGFVAAIYLQTQRYVSAVHFNQALRLDAKGANVQEVADKIAHAIKVDSSNDTYHKNLSVALFALANQKVAEKGLANLSTEDSNYVSNMIRNAFSAANKAVTLDSANSNNYLAVAKIFEGVLTTMEGADEKVIENYEKALELDPNNPALYQKVAKVYVLLSDIEVAKVKGQLGGSEELPEESKKYLALARKHLEKALEIKPDYVDANLFLVDVYEREGETDLAIQKELENKKLYPKEQNVAFRLGLLYYKQENFEEAKKEFQRALSIDKDYSNAKYFLGLIIDKEGDKELALKLFKDIKRLNPDNAGLDKIIENLESGRSALVGLDENEQEPPEAESVPEEDAPEIDPNVEAQDIPAEATPSIEDIEGENSPAEQPESIEDPEEQPAE